MAGLELTLKRPLSTWCQESRILGLGGLALQHYFVTLCESFTFSTLGAVLFQCGSPLGEGVAKLPGSMFADRGGKVCLETLTLLPCWRGGGHGSLINVVRISYDLYGSDF